MASVRSVQPAPRGPAPPSKRGSAPRRGVLLKQFRNALRRAAARRYVPPRVALAGSVRCRREGVRNALRAQRRVVASWRGGPPRGQSGSLPRALPRRSTRAAARRNVAPRGPARGGLRGVSPAPTRGGPRRFDARSGASFRGAPRGQSGSSSVGCSATLDARSGALRGPPPGGSAVQSCAGAGSSVTLDAQRFTVRGGWPLPYQSVSGARGTRRSTRAAARRGAGATRRAIRPTPGPASPSLRRGGHSGAATSAGCGRSPQGRTRPRSPQEPRRG